MATVLQVGFAPTDLVMVSAGEGFEPWMPPQAPGPPWGGWPSTPGGQYTGPPPMPPRPPSSGPRWVIAAIVVAGVLVIALGGVALAVVLRGRTRTTATASSGTSTTTSTTGARHVTSDVALANMGVQPGDLGVNWADYGVQAYSEDLANPPADCARYAGVFATRDAGSVRQYSFNPHAGYEDGGLSSTVIENPSRGAVAAQLPAVRKAAFAACAEATAQEWLTNHEGQVTVLDLHAEPIELVAAANVAGWRATVDYSDVAGRATFAMDIFYASARNYVAKVRVALCPCQPQPGASLALVPDEAQAVSAVSERISAAASGSTSGAAITEPSPVPPVALSDPCQLLTPAQVGVVIGAAKPPARITTGDEANECTWLASDGKSVVIQSGDSIVQFQTRLRDVPQPIAGLGDQAAVDPEFAGKVLVRKGNMWIEVFVEGTTSDREHAINLAKTVLPKL